MTIFICARAFPGLLSNIRAKAYWLLPLTLKYGLTVGLCKQGLRLNTKV